MSSKNPQVDSRQVVVEALKLTQERGWHGFGFADLAAEIGVPLSVLYDLFLDKEDLLVELGRMIDRQVLANIGGGDADESLRPRERLFDVMMERFDVLNEYRGGVVALLNAAKRDPKLAVMAMPHIARSMGWMMEIAGVDAQGLSGAVKVAGLSVIYLNGLRIWVDDDTTDMAKVMAALDSGLEKAEGFAERWA